MAFLQRDGKTDVGLRVSAAYVCGLIVYGIALNVDGSSPAGKPVAVSVEGFETYASSEQVAKIWYRPPHGGKVEQSLDAEIKSAGKYGLKFAYHTTKDPATHYGAICRVSKWDLSGTDRLQFWLKPDGSGRKLTVQLNIANKAGKNIHDLWDFVYFPRKGDTTPRIVTVPFSALEHDTKYADAPDVSPVFKPESVIEVALYIGGREDNPGDGVYYFDEFVARGGK